MCGWLSQCRTAQPNLVAWPSDVDIKGVLPDTCVLRIASNNVASQVRIAVHLRATTVQHCHGLVYILGWLRL